MGVTSHRSHKLRPPWNGSDFICLCFSLLEMETSVGGRVCWHKRNVVGNSHGRRLVYRNDHQGRRCWLSRSCARCFYVLDDDEEKQQEREMETGRVFGVSLRRHQRDQSEEQRGKRTYKKGGKRSYGHYTTDNDGRKKPKIGSNRFLRLAAINRSFDRNEPLLFLPFLFPTRFPSFRLLASWWTLGGGHVYQLGISIFNKVQTRVPPSLS